MGYDRNPVFGYGNRGPKVEEDSLGRTYNELKALDTGSFESLKTNLDKMVSWMGLARIRLQDLHDVKVVQEFPVLIERVNTLKWLVVTQWGVIGFLALLIWKRNG